MYKIWKLKKIFIVFVLSLFFLNNANANNCLIENNSSKQLENYLTNLRTLLKNISEKAKNETKKSNLSSFQNKSYTLQYFNEIFDFRNFKEEINFSSFYLQLNEIPKELDRDFQKLRSESEYISELVEFISKNNLYRFSVWEDICLWVKNCSLEKFWTSEIWWILEKIWKNHEKIKNYMILFSASKDISLKESNSLILVENNFIQDLKTYYWKEALSNCSKANWFFWEISKKTTDIYKNFNFAKNWVQKWKDAWALASGIDTYWKDNYEAVEYELLKRELNKQWIWWDNQANMLKNLEKFNKEWFSKNNNYISYTLKNNFDDLKSDMQDVWQEAISDFWLNHAQKTKTSDVTIMQSLNVQNNSDRAKDISTKIHTMYLEAKNYSAISEDVSSNLRTRLINTHKNLSNAINTLSETCKIAVKVCNQQDYWNWNCWDCNW